jgi:hypothetical protein
LEQICIELHPEMPEDAVYFDAYQVTFVIALED